MKFKYNSFENNIYLYNSGKPYTINVNNYKIYIL